MERRELLTRTVLLLAMGNYSCATGQTNASDDRRVGGDSVAQLGLLTPRDDPEFGHKIAGEAAPGSPIGTRPSRHEEVRQGFKYLLDAPRGDVMRAARYFAALKKTNADDEPYNQEWASRANPVIVGLFALTGTAPADGDQTSWCAAFVSFCLYLADKENRFTALSGGYRSFGKDVTKEPREGDIAVFAKYGPEGNKGFGHVGFFVRRETRGDAAGVVVLGGNQRGDTKSSGAVVEAWFPLDGHGLYLHSVRRIPG